MRKICKLLILVLFYTLIVTCMSDGVQKAKPVMVEQPMIIQSGIKQDTPAKLTTPEHDNIKISELSGGPELVMRTEENNLSVSKAVYSKVVYYSGPSSSRQVALTFDDGPDVYFTTQILDILKKEDVKATFFVIGERAQAHPEMVKRIVNEGHVIGNHTWDHPYLPKSTSQKVHYEISKTDEFLDSLLGFHPTIFRPPYGAVSPEIIKETSSLGYSIINWSVDTRDWAGTSPEQIMGYVKKEIYPGGIILQHCAGGKKDNLSNTVKALPVIISTLRSQKYKFVSIPELLQIQYSRK